MAEKKQVEESLFGMLCFLVLISTLKGGILEVSPDYIEEKYVMVRQGFAAFSRLDAFRKGVVLGYLSKWGYEIPKELKPYIDEIYQACKNSGVPETPSDLPEEVA